MEENEYKVGDECFLYWFGKVRKFKVHIIESETHVILYRKLCPLRKETLRVPKWMLERDIVRATVKSKEIRKNIGEIRAV